MKTNGPLERPSKEHAGYRVLLAMTSCLALWVALVTFVALPRLGLAESSEPGKELFEKRCSGCHAHITWDSESLDRWLSGPDKFVPDADMAFHVESATERRAIIAYLKEVR